MRFSYVKEQVERYGSMRLSGTGELLLRWLNIARVIVSAMPSPLIYNSRYRPSPRPPPHCYAAIISTDHYYVFNLDEPHRTLQGLWFTYVGL